MRNIQRVIVAYCALIAATAAAGAAPAARRPDEAAASTLGSRTSPAALSRASGALMPACRSVRKKMWVEDEGWIVRRVPACT